MNTPPHPDVGIVFDRPDRSRLLAQKLRERGLGVTVYNKTPGAAMNESFLRLLTHVVTHTRHQIYMTSMCFNPALSLYVNDLLTGRPYIFVMNGADWNIYDDFNHRLPFPGARARHLYPFLLRRIARRAAHIVCNSRFLLREFVGRHPETRQKSSAIYNGIDFERFSPSVSTERRGGAQLLTVTTWTFSKKSAGTYLILDAMEEVLGARPDAHLTIAVKTNGSPRTEIEQYVARKPWSHRVTLLYNHERIEELLRQSDVFLFSTPPDSNDSLPRAVLEAQAAGLPVVTTATAGCAEVVSDGETGFTVPYEAAALSGRVIQVIDDLDLRRRLGQNAQSRVRKLFTWDDMADSYATIIRKSLGSSTVTER